MITWSRNRFRNDIKTRCIQSTIFSLSRFASNWIECRVHVLHGIPLIGLNMMNPTSLSGKSYCFSASFSHVWSIISFFFSPAQFRALARCMFIAFFFMLADFVSVFWLLITKKIHAAFKTKQMKPSSSPPRTGRLAVTLLLHFTTLLLHFTTAAFVFVAYFQEARTGRLPVTLLLHFTTPTPTSRTRRRLGAPRSGGA